MTRPEALRLAESAHLGYRVGWQRQAADELRRLHGENETLRKSVAILQEHHATAWNRGHTMGMKANEDTARRALDAVKQDSWGNTQLTEALLKAEAQRDALLEALKTMLAAGHGTSGRLIVGAADEAAARAAIKTVEHGK